MELQDELKILMESIQQQKFEVKEKKDTFELKKIKGLCKNFSFSASIFIESLALRLSKK